jgi:hypothetical protein
MNAFSNPPPEMLAEPRSTNTDPPSSVWPVLVKSPTDHAPASNFACDCSENAGVASAVV